MEIIDQYHGDPLYTQLHVLLKSRPAAREVMKTASFDTQQDTLDNLPSSAFAWEDERRFPVHTKEDTVASILYRSKLGSKVPETVDHKLVKAAKVYGISRDVFSDGKTASEEAPVTYALPDRERLPLDSVESIKVAEHVLCRDYSRLNLEERATGFSRLVKAASDFDYELQPLSHKMAGLTISSTRTLCDWLEARASVSEGPHQEAYDKLASELEKAPPYIKDRKSLLKLAGAIGELDKQAGLDAYYDRKLPDPILTVFNTEKIAMLTCDVVGQEVACEELMSLPPEVWEQVDAPELAELAEAGDETMFKQVFDTMPLDIKVVLQEYL